MAIGIFECLAENQITFGRRHLVEIQGNDDGYHWYIKILYKSYMFDHCESPSKSIRCWKAWKLEVWIHHGAWQLLFQAPWTRFCLATSVSWLFHDVSCFFHGWKWYDIATSVGFYPIICEYLYDYIHGITHHLIPLLQPVLPSPRGLNPRSMTWREPSRRARRSWNRRWLREKFAVFFSFLSVNGCSHLKAVFFFF